MHIFIHPTKHHTTYYHHHHAHYPLNFHNHTSFPRNAHRETFKSPTRLTTERYTLQLP
ncbi:hypothetical protein, partial [Paenibacillus xylanexedens]|uniref:hypothetical protein n=1 Tax=Paenibacillus xylanexedens TaxID=528191 RepID=UPI0034D95EF1